MIEIYYVEDDWAIAETVKQYLEQKNIRVMRYATLAQAREALASHLPALVLLDWNMPDGHGDSLCQWIRRNWKELPIIFLQFGEIVRRSCAVSRMVQMIMW